MGERSLLSKIVKSKYIILVRVLHYYGRVINKTSERPKGFFFFELFYFKV